jgi:hypothetical protein
MPRESRRHSPCLTASAAAGNKLMIPVIPVTPGSQAHRVSDRVSDRLSATAFVK